MNGIIQAKIIGGAGNSFFQYACTRAYSELIGARFECGDWAGRRIFNLDDPYPSRILPERNDGGNGDEAHALKWGETDVKIGGYFQFQDWIKHLSRAKLKEWFKIDQKWMAMMPAPIMNPPRVAAHLRKGDYLQNSQFCNVSRQSYLNAMKEHDLGTEIEWVDQAEPMHIKAMDDSQLWYLADFIRLMRADVILRANSTFSWWAAVLSNARVFSPVVGDLIGPNDVRFVEGNFNKFCDSSRAGVKITDLYLPD